MTMEAVRFNATQKTLCLEKVAIPQNPGPDEVIVAVAYAGICGTDLHIIDGEFPCQPGSVTLGHEFSGTVTEVGSAVKHVKKGDRVSVDPNTSCYCCHSCTSGSYHLCEVASINATVGIWKDGGFAPFCKVPSSQVFLLPDTVTTELGALTEPVSCLSHGLDRLGNVAMGSRILILGAGIIGILWANALHLVGHRRITVSEPSDARRKLVENLGLGIEAVTPQQLQERREKNASYGVDVVIDCSGNARAIEGAFDFLLPGGKLLIFGVSHPDARISLSPFTIYKKELSILGVLVNPYSFPKALAYLESFNEQYLEFKKIGIQVFKLSEYKEAIKAVRSGDISKAVFKIK